MNFCRVRNKRTIRRGAGRSVRRTASTSSQKKSKSVKTKSETKSKKKGSYKGFAHNCKVLTRLKAKESYAYLNDCPSQALQQTLKNMDKVFQRFFKKEARYPVFDCKIFLAIECKKMLNY